MSDELSLERPFFEDVEALFSEYVEYYGGKIVSKLDINKTDRQNADYLFNTPDVIAELKTFKKDVFSETEDIPRLEDLFTKWIENKTITGDELRDYTFRGKPLPNACLQDLINMASKTIERAIYKANRQIEETKKTFGRANSNGIVFLINDGNYFFSNQGFLAVIANLIGRKFEDASFDVIVYITVNQVTRREDSQLDYTVWIPIYTKADENGKTIVSDELHHFVNDFGSKFLNDFLTEKTGHEPKDHMQIENLEDSLEELKKQKFIPKNIIYKK
jgi:hypothetical protein